MVNDVEDLSVQAQPKTLADINIAHQRFHDKIDRFAEVEKCHV